MSNAVRQLAIGSQQFRFIRAVNMNTTPDLVDLSQDTMRGNMQPHEDDFVEGLRKHRWKIFLQPNPAEISSLLPKIGFSSGTPWTPQATLNGMETSFSIDLGARVITYAAAVVDKCIITGARGDTPITWELDILCKEETDLANWAAGSFSAIPAGRPYMFQQATTTLQGSSRSFLRFALAFDFHVSREWYNSVNATEIEPCSWDVTYVPAVRYNSANETLYSDPRDSGTRAAGSLTWTGTGVSTAWNFTSLIPRTKTPDILRRNETAKLGLMYKVARTTASSTNMMTVTHDATP